MTNQINSTDDLQFDNYPNDKYKKFFGQFSEINSLEIKQWRPVHLLAYFCRLYQKAYDTKYQFKFNSPAPSKCYEVFIIKKIGILLSSDPVVLKQYFDWGFKARLATAKRKLTSISFLAQEDLIKEFKLNFLFKQNSPTDIVRSTPLPDNFKQIAQTKGFPVQTYGDLAFLYHAHQSGDQTFAPLFEELNSQSFDSSLLNQIK